MGGITRFKHHLGHISGNVAGCTEVPREVRKQMKAFVGQNKTRKVEIKEKGGKILMLPVMKYLGMNTWMRKMHIWRLHAESPS